VGTEEVRRNALVELLVQLAKREAFAQLRTREQLGYIVSLYSTRDNGVFSLQVRGLRGGEGGAGGGGRTWHLAERLQEAQLWQQLQQLWGG
jgi:hypothetical protein